MGIIILGIIVITAIVLISSYNSIIKKKNQVENAEGSVNTALKKRHDLIPNLIECVKQEQTNKTELLDKLNALNNSINTSNLNEERFNLENEISSLSREVMKEYISKTGKNPKQTLHLQKTWTEIEEQISASRRFFNSAVTDYNTRIEVFPSNLFASSMKLEKKKVFRATLKEKLNPKAKNLFK